MYKVINKPTLDQRIADWQKEVSMFREISAHDKAKLPDHWHLMDDLIAEREEMKNKIEDMSRAIKGMQFTIRLMTDHIKEKL